MITFTPHVSVVALLNGYLVVTIREGNAMATAHMTLEHALSYAAKVLTDARGRITDQTGNGSGPQTVKLAEQHIKDVAQVLQVEPGAVRKALRDQLGIDPFFTAEESDE